MLIRKTMHCARCLPRQNILPALAKRTRHTNIFDRYHRDLQEHSPIKWQDKVGLALSLGITVSLAANLWGKINAKKKQANQNSI